MADAALVSALQKLAVVAAKKGLELYEVHNQIEPMRRNLEMIQAFLRDADSNQQKSESGKVWVNQVRDLAYRIGSAMDTFLVEIEKNYQKSSGFLKKFKRVLKHPIKFNTLSGEFKAINEEMTRIYNTRTLLGITELGGGVEQPAELPFRPTKPIDIEDSEVVGFDADKDKIISHLLDKNISRRTVLSIVGVGGLGKTTLASKVYKCAELDVEFSCRAWVSISQSFDANKVCREILYSMEPTMKERSPPDEEVWEELKKSLSGKRYLIILDDVWTTDLWERFKKVIPDNNNASRIIITTRNLDVALASDRRTQPHNLRYLTEDESLTLLFIKAQQDVQLGKYPSHLVEVAKKLIEKCGRLPLALVVLDCLLGTKPDTCSSWTNVYKTLDWHLNKEVNKCTQILRLSYQELSYEQKQRFLYFAAFPEDHKISSEHIIRLWIAEGLVSEDGEGTMEEQAEDYLEDLVKRCLVQVLSGAPWYDEDQYCVMHDLVRDLAIHEAQEENFFTVFSKPEDSSKHATKEIHRVALQQLHTPAGYNIHSTNIRSLLCFGGSTVPSNMGFAAQLRVLVIENIDFKEIEVGKNWLENLVHIRYLGFRKCGAIEKIVDNISCSFMKNLETFDFYGSWWYSDLCDKENSFGPLWEVPTLRHVIFQYGPYVPGPLKWDNLKNLQTLQWVVLTDIPKLEINLNLCTLSIKFRGELKSPEKSWKALKALLSRAENLVTLDVYYDGNILFNADGMRKLPCYETIQSLFISGPWERDRIPSFEIFPKYLTKLWLSTSRLKEDPMPILERLPYLTILWLFQAYVGKKMVCSTGGFPNLQILILSDLRELNEWEIEEGAMPCLSKLTIHDCRSLSPFPELQNVTSLQELIVSIYTSKQKMRLESEDLYKIKHIPSVRFECPLMLSGLEYSNDREDDGEEDGEEDDGEDNDEEEDGDVEEDDDVEEEDNGEGDNDDGNEGEDEDDDDNEGEDDN